MFMNMCESGKKHPAMNNNNNAAPSFYKVDRALEKKFDCLLDFECECIVVHWLVCIEQSIHSPLRVHSQKNECYTTNSIFQIHLICFIA